MTDDNDLDDDSETPNDNCLRGLRCPECRSWEPLLIGATAIFEVFDSGTESYGSVEWDDDSPCQCGSCQFAGIVEDFHYTVTPLLEFTRRVFAEGGNSVEESR